jgi:fused signal recognition particle receptor
MFNFLKEKLKSALSKFTKDVDEEAEDVVEEPKKEKLVEKKEKPKAEKKPEKKEAPKEVPKAKPITVKKEEVKPEEKEVVLPVEEKPAPPPLPQAEEPKNLSVELVGIKETLETYSAEDIDKMLGLMGFSDFDVKGASRDEKISMMLKRPLAEIESAMDKFEAPQLDEEQEEKKEEEEIEELEKEEEKLEEPKKGFFKRLFGFGKKKEVEEKAEEEAEVEEPSLPEKEEVEMPPLPEEKEEVEEKPKKKEKAAIPETLDYVSKEIEKEKEEVEEEDKEIQEKEAEIEEEEKPAAREDEPEEKKGFFSKLTEGLTLKTLSESKFDSIFFELEVALLENNVAVEVIEKIKKDLHDGLVDKKLKRSDIDRIIGKTLISSISEILSVPQVDILGKIKQKRKENKPYVIIFVGINGSGKTTTIAKMAKYFMNNNLKIVMVASDTFRAAAIQQLEEHANNLGVKIIKHDYGSDPAAVAFDGIKYAEAKGIDVVLVDTAGRLQSNVNLMDEMKKVIRVAKPDMKIFIGESITGNDCIEQAQAFNAAIDIDGIVLSKADVDEKGGAALSVSYVTGKPILFIGTGQTYDSLQKFDKKLVLENLGLS